MRVLTVQLFENISIAYEITVSIFLVQFPHITIHLKWNRNE